jgi:hypothetical protein
MPATSGTFPFDPRPVGARPYRAREISRPHIGLRKAIGISVSLRSANRRAIDTLRKAIVRLWRARSVQAHHGRYKPDREEHAIPRPRDRRRHTRRHSRPGERAAGPRRPRARRAGALRGVVARSAARSRLLLRLCDGSDAAVAVVRAQAAFCEPPADRAPIAPSAPSADILAQTRAALQAAA